MPVPLTLLKRWIERSTSKDTATNIVNTVATDHVGVKARDRISSAFSDILNNPSLKDSKPLLPKLQKILVTYQSRRKTFQMGIWWKSKIYIPHQNYSKLSPREYEWNILYLVLFPHIWHTGQIQNNNMATFTVSNS